MKFSTAQVAALRKFALPGGHDFGNASVIRWSTARFLERHGLIVVVEEHGVQFGLATPSGASILRNLDGAHAPE